MSDFAGMEDLLQDFLAEAGELLSDVDNKLVELEKRGDDVRLLNDIFRGFHTIKGGAGFLNVAALVELCHLTENLFDLLCNKKLALTPEIMDAILEATAALRDMFIDLGRGRQAAPAARDLLGRLQAIIRGETPAPCVAPEPAVPPQPQGEATEPDWDKFYHALVARPAPAAAGPAPARSHGRRATDDPEVDAAPAGRRDADKLVVAKDSTIRIDTHRLDQVLNLSGEIGLTKNRLNCLRHEILAGNSDGATLRALDGAVNQLDLLVGDLQNAVMKTRMQPIGRLFQKYPRMARDLARSLGKDIELVISGEETELDRSMIDELADPLVHLVRNAVDHGVETPEERRAAGKHEKGCIRLSAQQVGDRILIEIADDGRGMQAKVLRRKAFEKGLIDAEAANALDERQSLHLIFLPGFSTKDRISNVSGRGVGMDVVRNNVQKLNGRVEIRSTPGGGTTFAIALPLTLAILPVLIVKHGAQSFALPLAMVHEVISIDPAAVQAVGGRPTLVVRGQVLPVRTLAGLIGWAPSGPLRYGVLMQSAAASYILAVDGYAGREDVVIKPLDDIKPKGVAGATLSGDGSVVLVLDMEALLAAPCDEPGVELFAAAA